MQYVVVVSVNVVGSWGYCGYCCFVDFQCVVFQWLLILVSYKVLFCLGRKDVLKLLCVSVCVLVVDRLRVLKVVSQLVFMQLLKQVGLLECSVIVQFVFSSCLSEWLCRFGQIFSFLFESGQIVSVICLVVRCLMSVVLLMVCML